MCIYQYSMTCIPNIGSYKAAAYNVTRAVEEAKSDHSKKVEQQFQEGNPTSVWQGLRTMTDYKPTHSSLSSADASLASELNNLYTPCCEAISSQQKQLRQRLIDGWVHLSHQSPFLSVTSGGLSSV